MTKFKEYIKGNYDCSLYKIFTNYNYPSLSEYGLLGLYAELFELENNYVFLHTEKDKSQMLPVKAFWNWGGMTDDVQNEIRQIVSAS